MLSLVLVLFRNWFVVLFGNFVDLIGCGCRYEVGYALVIDLWFFVKF